MLLITKKFKPTNYFDRFDPIHDGMRREQMTDHQSNILKHKV